MPSTLPRNIHDLAGLHRWLDTNSRQRHWRHWRWQLRAALTTADLARFGLLDVAALRAAKKWPARVTPYFLFLSVLSDQSDPLTRQWLPAAAELMPDSNARDPFDETHLMPVPGVVQRFPDRVVVLTHAACATTCRHCTRRHTLVQHMLVDSPARLQRVLTWLRATPSVREVLLTGGDPLLLPNDALLRLVRAFAALPQLDAIRIGTRVPVVLPMRITPALAHALGASHRVWVNTQFNHVREITPDSTAACARLVDAGIPVSNQTVLLRGVNNSVDAMTKLCAGLQRIRVRPYYVFLCDPVRGTAHLRTSRTQARTIARGVASRLGGLATPRFVIDLPGKPYKMPI